MLDALKSLFGQNQIEEIQPRMTDPKLAAAALMVHVIAADGTIEPAEDARLRDILATHYDVEDVDALVTQAKAAHEQAIDLYGFTAVLKAKMDEAERLALVEDLWEMVYADGHLHEMEDNVVWRVAELLSITSDKRIALKVRVKNRAKTGAKAEPSL